MNKVRFTADNILKLFNKKNVVTIDELKAALGTDVDMTVLRKLRELSYHSSYTHRGMYYTLDSIAKFNELGLWLYKKIGFSLYGTLIQTALNFVNTSQTGYTVSELNQAIGVETKQSLLQLYRQEDVKREKMENVYVYFSRESKKYQRQHLGRLDILSSNIHASKDGGSEVLAHELKAAIILFYSLLDEKHRRLYAGLESLKIGHGGDSAMARMLGLNNRTIAKGRRELLSGNPDISGTRKPGNGRNSVKKTSQR